MEAVTDFIFLGSKITVDGDCSDEIKRCLLLGRKAITSLDSVLKSRDVTLLTKVHTIKAMVFPVVMYGCESWTIKKAEHQRTDAFKAVVFLVVMMVVRVGSEAEAPILCPPDEKSWLIRKDPDTGKDWRQGEKGTTEDKMVGWHHGHKFE